MDAIDAATLSQLRALGAGDDLIELFLTEAPATLAALGQAVAHGDASELRELAHSLKGSCRYLGALQMAALLAELEQIGSRGSTADAAALLAQIEQEFDHVRHALVSYQHVSNQE